MFGFENTSRSGQRWLLLTLSSLSLFSFIAALALRFEFQLGREDWIAIAFGFPVLAVYRMLGFEAFDIRKRRASAWSVADILPISASVVFPSIAFALTSWTILSRLGISRAAIMIDCLVMLILVNAWLSLPRLLEIRRERSSRTRQRTLVVMNEVTNDALKTVIEDPRFKPVGFVSKVPVPPSTRIYGIPYLGSLEQIESLCSKHDANLLAITNTAQDQKALLDLTSNATRLGLEYVLLRPGRRNRYLSIPLVEEVGIEVLLQREEVGINRDQVHEFVSGKVVLVTGAGGSIGSELSRQLASHNPTKLYLLDHSENSLFFIERELRERHPGLAIQSLLVDITDDLTLRQEFSDARPNLVFHAAAHKHVGMMEGRPQAALRNNLLGTSNVAFACAEFGVERMINISTDKAVRPKSFMGLSKRLAEMVIAAMNESTATHFVTVRFGNVAGSNGSVVQLFDQQLRRNTALTVTDKEATRFFMSIPEAVRLVLQAGAFAKTGGIFMLDMGTPIRIYELARTMIRLSGQRPDIDLPIRFTGLASAEKMNEELTDDGENALPTSHSRILGIKSSEASKGQRILDRLPEWRRMLKAGDHEPVFAELPAFWPADTQVDLSRVLPQDSKVPALSANFALNPFSRAIAGGKE